MPAASSRRRIQYGLLADGSTPDTLTTTKRSQPAGSSMVTGHGAGSPAVSRMSASATSVNGTSKAADSSRARPRIDSA